MALARWVVGLLTTVVTTDSDCYLTNEKIIFTHGLCASDYLSAGTKL